MRSKIRVEYDFDKKEPYLQLFLEIPEEDLADRTLSHFIEEGTKNGFKVVHPRNNEYNNVPQIRLSESENSNEIRQNVRTNSIKFREWLDSKSIQWEPNEHMTTIIGDYDKYDLGFEFGRYYSDNAPRP